MKDFLKPLTTLLRQKSRPQIQRRLKILYLQKKGLSNDEIALILRVSHHEIHLTFSRFHRFGLENLLISSRKPHQITLTKINKIKVEQKAIQRHHHVESNPILKRRLKVLLLTAQGLTLLETSKETGMSIGNAHLLVKKFCQLGLEGYLKREARKHKKTL